MNPDRSHNDLPVFILGAALGSVLLYRGTN